PHHPAMSRSNSKPKGILKNAPQPNPQPQHSLQWDEENIALTEAEKGGHMKITEPKTPYVRYNAETDTFEGEIPNLDLSGQASSPTTSIPPISPSSTGATGGDTSAPSSRRTSFSSTGRAPSTGRPGSGTSSRSTSFSLPNEARETIRDLNGRQPGDEIEDEEMDEETAAKHQAFLRARGRHYSNEAEAMKARPPSRSLLRRMRNAMAKQLMEEEDEDSTDVNNTDAESQDLSMEDDTGGHVNGIGRA
ncbi:hypothetical protein K474DRAFT_1564800, partial [Panus rudis PR-1116 ss-1]